MLIGRKEEILKLERAYGSEYSEFVAVYGRRRIGKTYLINETFRDKFSFHYTGIYNVSNREQLDEFTRCLYQHGLNKDTSVPKNWFEAFGLLREFLESTGNKRKIVFLDELPWMDSPNSKFLPAFEHFWNGWASNRKDILLIICGSATSWIINKIFRNKGGLYNRVTYKMLLKQFSLHECEEMVEAYNLPYNRNMIMEGYMVMGGIPYYWSKLDPAKSINKNINDLFLMPEGELRDEFKYIYSSMFRTPEKYIKVIEALSGKTAGLTREDIVKKGKLENNGHVTSILEDLIECGFVRKYCHTGKKRKDALYQLIDCYSLFYYHFVRQSYNVDEEYWVRIMRIPAYNTWCGLAFERVCLLHTRQIKMALGISGIMANIFSWQIKKTDEHPGVQIDLLIDRADNVIDVCEMKYASDGYMLTAKSLENFRTKLNVLKQYMPQKKYIELVLITSNGLIKNRYSGEILHNIKADQLFQT